MFKLLFYLLMLYKSVSVLCRETSMLSCCRFMLDHGNDMLSRYRFMLETELIMLTGENDMLTR